MLACWWVGKPPVLINEGTDPKTALAGCLISVEQAPPNGYCQHLYPQGELPFLAASPGDSPRSASGSHPGPFRSASVLRFGICEIGRVPFKSRVSVSCSPPVALLNLSPTGFQSQMFWGLIFLVQEPWAGERDVGLRTLWRNLCDFNILPICGLLTRGCGS